MAFLKRLLGRQDKGSTDALMRGQADAVQTPVQPGPTPATIEPEVAAAQEPHGESATSEEVDRDQAIIARVSEAFAGMMLDARSVDVHTVGGGLSPTLRFTLNETASTDLPRERIAATKESVEELANLVIVELRRQVVG